MAPKQNGRTFLIIVALTVLQISKTSAVTKQWKFTSSWGDPDNWIPPRLPCPDDEIMLKDGVVFMNRNITTKALVLPYSGELILDDDLQLTFEDDPILSTRSEVKNCTGQDYPIEFVGNKAKQWLNPLNWEILEDRIPSSYTSASLFTDRVPCETDVVTFPSNDAYHIQVSKAVHIGSMVLNGKVQNKEQLDAFFRSSDGRRRFEFTSDATISVSGKICGQSWGCPCGNSKLKKIICSSFQCPPSCEQSVRPVGDCCDHCGAVVIADIFETFNLQTCQETLRNKLISMKFNEVRLVISPIDNRRTQVLITDALNGTKSVRAARIVTDYLKDSSDEACKGHSVRLITGTATIKSPQIGKDKRSIITMVVVLTLVLLAIIVIAAVFMWRRRGSSVLKQHTLHNDATIAGVVDIDFIDTTFCGGVLSMKDNSVENPLYGHLGPSGLLPDSPKFEIPVSPPKGASTNRNVVETSSFSNPIYNEGGFPAHFDDIVDQVFEASDGGLVNPLCDIVTEDEDLSVFKSKTIHCDTDDYASSQATNPISDRNTEISEASPEVEFQKDIPAESSA